MYIALAIFFVVLTVCVMIASSFIRTWAVNIKPDEKTEQEKKELSEQIEKLKAAMALNIEKNADNNSNVETEETN